MIEPSSSSLSSSPTPFAEHPLVWNGTIEQRLYQKNIAAAARCKNTLVILPTALGKTTIAALVCAEMLYSHREKRVLMMAPTRPLVSQHLRSFSTVLKVPEEQLAMVTGKTVPEARRAVWDKRDIRLVFATPEVVRNDLEEGRLHLKDFILLVFDEAHRAVKDYAYTAIAREYVGQSMHPVILAMTASPGAKKDRIQEVCDNLRIEHVEYRSEEDIDVKPYVNPIDVKWEWFDLPEEYRYISSILQSMLDERLKWLIQRGLLGKKKDTRWIFKRDLIEAGEALRYRLELTMEEQRGPLYVAIMNQSAALTLMYCLELIESQGSHSLKAFFERMELEGEGGGEGEGKRGKAGRGRGGSRRTHTALLKDPKMMEIRTLVEKDGMEHPKVRRIVELVEEYLTAAAASTSLSSNSSTKKTSARVLVFTQYRDTARHIVDVLQQQQQQQQQKQQKHHSKGIRASRFVGQAKRQGDRGMNQDEQAAVLESFRNGEFDVLVATSIAEEGLDIPEVDLVVFYEPIPSEIRYIQRRGRTGRKSAGSVVILAANDTIDTRHLYASKRRVEKMKDSLSSINAVLRPLNRVFVEPDPMTADELAVLEEARAKVEERLRRDVIKELEKKGDGDGGGGGDSPGIGGEVEAKAQVEAEVKSRLQQLRRKAAAVEEDMLTGEFKRGVDRAARHIHTELAKAGVKGVDIDLLRDYLSLDYPVLNEALRKLEKLKRLAWRDEGTVVLADNLRTATGETYSVEVEKVVQGRAVVMINKKWRARLNHYDYAGPRELLKRGTNFNAIGELYHHDGVLNLKVKQIV